MTEMWKDVVGFEGRYQISDQGRVKSCARIEPYKRHGGDHVRAKFEKILRASRSGDYLTVRLCGETKNVHTLVLEAFVGPRPAGMTACHGPDFDGTNNVLTNLRWGTYKENNDERRPFIRTVGPHGKMIRTPGSRRHRKETGAKL